MVPSSVQFPLLHLTITSLLSSYQFDFFTNHPYDDLLEMTAHKNEQCMSDSAVFQSPCSIYTIPNISLLEDVRTVIVDVQQL